MKKLCAMICELIVGLALLYAVSYFRLSNYDDCGSIGIPERVFKYGVLMDVYYPMGWIECRVRGEMLNFQWDGTVTFDADGVAHPSWNYWVFNP